MSKTFGRAPDSWSAYEVLGLPHDVSAGEAKKAYQHKLKEAHPDKGGSPEQFQRLQRAFDVVLKDVAARSERAPTVRMSDLSAHAGQHEGSSDEDDEAAVPSTSGDAHVADPVQLADVAKSRGNAAFGAGDHGAAFTHYSNALAWAPADATLWSNRSATRMKLGAHQGALDDADEAVRLNARWPKAHYRRGLALRALGSLPDAAAAFQRSLELDPALKDAETALEAVERLIADGSCWKVLRSHEGGVYAASFRPVADGCAPLLATASFDKSVRLWNATDMQCRHVLRDHQDKVTAAVWSSSGALLATASLDQKALLYRVPPDGNHCTLVATMQGHAGRVTAVCFTPDESVLCTACTDGKARVWDVATGGCRHTLDGHSQHIPAMAMTPDGRLLATISGDGMIRTWEVATGQELDTLDWAASGAVNLCRFTPRGLGASGGSLLITAHIDLKRNEGRILMWDVDRTNSKVPVRGYCKQLPSATMPYKDRIEDMDVGTNEDGEVVLAFGGAVGAFGVVDVASGTTLFTSLDEHMVVQVEGQWDHLPKSHYQRHAKPSANVNRVRLSPCGSRAATAGADHAVRVWDAETGEVLATLRGHSKEVKSLAWSPDGRVLVSASLDGTARCWRQAWGDVDVQDTAPPQSTEFIGPALPPGPPTMPQATAALPGWHALPV